MSPTGYFPVDDTIKALVMVLLQVGKLILVEADSQMLHWSHCLIETTADSMMKPEQVNR